MRDKVFYLTCFGLGAGVLWRSFARVDGYAVALGFIAIFLILFFSVTWRNKWGVLISVFALACSLGILRFRLADTAAPKNFEIRVGESASFSGMITDEPAKSETDVTFTVEVKERGEKTKITISTKKDEEYAYGDEIRFAGTLERPKNFLTDQGKEFDYVDYLRKDGVWYAMRSPKIDVLSRGHGSALRRALYRAREVFDAGLASALPAPERILAGALIMGERTSFSPSLRNSFIVTGTIHIVTISGYNVTIIAEWIMKLFAFLPLPYATLAGMVGIFFYVVMTGAAETAVRAGIMATLALVARATGRTYDIGRTLVLTGTAMVFANPLILAFDVSFELSFLATVAVIFLSPRVEEHCRWIKWKWFRDIVSVTVAAYMFVLPFILYKMGNFSLVALPANVAVLPIIPATMAFGFVTGFAGFFSHILARIAGAIAYLLLHYELAAIGFFSRLPFASLTVSDFPLALVVLMYTMFLRSMFGKNDSGKISRFIILIAPFFLTLIAAGLFYYRTYESNQAAKRTLEKLLGAAPAGEPMRPFTADARTKTTGCIAKGGLPDHACTPGAVFEDATVEQICVKGYTATVRSVSTSLRKKVYAEYGVSYPQPRGAYEVDHFVPLALGGSNDIANLFLEAAEPAPGFHEKDLVEIFLQQEVCSGRVALPVAQRQIANDWLSVYNNLSWEQITALKKKYRIP